MAGKIKSRDLATSYTNKRTVQPNSLSGYIIVFYTEVDMLLRV